MRVVKYIKLFLITLYYGSWSIQAFKYHCLNMQGMTEAEFREMLGSKGADTVKECFGWHD